MGEKYRIGTKVPWENHFRDWSHPFATIEDVVDELSDRAKNHRGKEFREMVRGEQTWGNDRELGMTLLAVKNNLKRLGFGGVVIVEANRDRVEWRIIKLRDVDPVEARPEANEHVNFIYGYVFSTHRDEYQGVESWGTCNRRYIDGTSIWSEHSPWHSPNPGCNAVDFHASYSVMYKLSRDLAGKEHVAKILFYGHEWTPETGWISNSSVGHYDHVHVEGPRNHGYLDSACHYG